jgi:chromosome segregation ATPase
MADNTASTESTATETTSGTESQRAAAAATASTESTEQTQQTTESTAQASADDRVAQLERELADAKEQQKKLVSESRKRKDKLTEERRASGNFQSLYEETSKELETASAELEQIRPQIEQKDAQIASLQKEIDGFRKGFVDRFEQADQAYAKTLPLDQLPALYERLYGKSMMVAPAERQQSPGHGKATAGAASAQSRLDAAVAARDNDAINAAINELLGIKK